MLLHLYRNIGSLRKLTSGYIESMVVAVVAVVAGVVAVDGVRGRSSRGGSGLMVGLGSENVLILVFALVLVLFIIACWLFSTCFNKNGFAGRNVVLLLVVLGERGGDVVVMWLSWLGIMSSSCAL